jgi:hypothetical protein
MIDGNTPATIPTQRVTFRIDTLPSRTPTGSTTPQFPPPEDPFHFAPSLPSASSPYLSPELMGMLPLPESPIPLQSTPYTRHRPTASMSSAISSGPHPPSPLSQTHLVASPEQETRHDLPQQH